MGDLVITGRGLPSTVVKTDQANTYSTGAQSFAAATMLIPNAATLPATCVLGEIYADNNETPAGQQVYFCSATNTWSKIGDGGGGGGAYTINGATGAAFSVSPEYVPLFAPNVNPTTTETQVAARFAQTVTTISKLYVRTSVTIAGGTTATYTLMKNGVAQPLTCTIAASTQDCNDPTNSFAVAANDLLSMRITYTGAPGTPLQFWSMLVTP